MKKNFTTAQDALTVQLEYFRLLYGSVGYRVSDVDLVATLLSRTRCSRKERVCLHESVALFVYA